MGKVLKNKVFLDIGKSHFLLCYFLFTRLYFYCEIISLGSAWKVGQLNREGECKRFAYMWKNVLYNSGMKSSDIENLRIARIPKVGRPKKWQTIEELETAIQDYFNSCFVKKTERKRVQIQNEDCECDLNAGVECKCPRRYEYIDEPIKDETGEFVLIQIRPFTVTGLAIALDTTRDTLLSYENNPENAQFFDTIKNAKQIIHNYAEEYLFSGKNVVGAIFNLKNNWGYVDRQENFNANVEVDNDKVKKKVNDMFGDD